MCVSSLKLTDTCTKVVGFEPAKENSGNSGTGSCQFDEAMSLEGSETELGSAHRTSFGREC